MNSHLKNRPFSQAQKNLYKTKVNSNIFQLHPFSECKLAVFIGWYHPGHHFLGGCQVEPPGLEPELADSAVWRHLLRGTHGFSLNGPEPVSLFPEAPDLARTLGKDMENVEKKL